MKLILRPASQQAQLVPAATIEFQNLDGATVLEVADDFTFDGKVIDWIALDLVEDVDGAKAAAGSAVSIAFQNALTSGCVTPKGRADCDEKSQARVTNAIVLMERGGPLAPDAISWTMFDGGVVAHDYDELVALGLSIGLQMQACFARKQVLEQAIAEALTRADVAAIDVNEGWPE